MKQILLIISLMAGLTFGSASAFANTCNSKARELAAGRKNVTLLSVKPAVNANGRTVCVITIRIVPGNGDLPRVVTRRIPL